MRYNSVVRFYFRPVCCPYSYGGRFGEVAIAPTRVRKQVVIQLLI